MQQETHIRRAIELARSAREHGNHPFGALLVDPTTDTVLLEAENTVLTTRNVTHHAELNLVSRASVELPVDVLKRAVLFTSTEPCPMCSGAIYWCGIRRVVYACSTEKLHQFAGPGLEMPCRQVFAKGSEPADVVGPLLEEEGMAVHDGFWGHP